ncbi:helix-turn-helix transcriptional regulator [Pseudonocardia acaciae]|uniref:helix-turn-helix transcriptional regulator n=1 Tax=Pseudonocardia acaciae TaxID=551276 RepID=UPI000490BC6E|nr:AAA family ATPase [Pseudonocardia acaciae]
MGVGLVSPLLERDAEQALLGAALADALAGSGRVALIQGSPGIGKTRLLDAVCARAGTDALVLRARGGEQERQFPLGVVRELFERPVSRAGARERLFAGAAGLAAAVFGIGRGEVSASTFSVTHGLYWLAANLAEARPLVLAVDDAQWADEASQDWLAYLIPRIEGERILLALTVRPRELDPASRLAAALGSLHDLVVLEPRELTAQGTATVVEELAGDAEQAFSASVHRATAGNPLLVRTLVRSLLAAGVEPTERNADRVEAAGGDRIGRIVLPRLHRLGPDAVALARAAAILGETCQLRDAGELAGLDPGPAAAATDALVATEVLRPDGSPGFTHPLMRATVINELAPGARSELHRRAAVLLAGRHAGPEAVAQHVVAVRSRAEPWMVEVLRAGAGVALARGAPRAAIGYLERAMAENPPDGQRVDILLDLGAAGLRSRHPDTTRWLDVAARTASSPVQRAQAVFALVESAGYRGEDLPDTAWEALWARQGDQPPALEALRTIAEYGFWGNRPAPPAQRPRREMPTGRTWPECTWLAIAAFQALMDRAPATRVIELAEGALRGGVLLAENPEAFAHPFAAWCLQRAGRMESAFEAVDEALGQAVRGGSMASFEIHSTLRAIVQLQRGRLSEAEADTEASVSADDEYGWVLGRSRKTAVLIGVLAERYGPMRAAEALAARGHGPDAPDANVLDLPEVEARGWLNLALGRPEAALADLLACGRRLEELHSRSSALFGWRAGAARCLAVLGRRDEAEELAAEQVRDARAFGAAPWLGQSLRAHGAVLGGDDGIDLLREAVAVLEPSEGRLEHTHALHELGMLLRHNRHPRDAREPLRQALGLAGECGTPFLADAVADELRATGARPRRRAVTGVEALTASEHRIAQLAADGMTNTEIAQCMFVTRKAVEKHLGNAYRKLSIASRTELAAALAATARR